MRARRHRRPSHLPGPAFIGLTSLHIGTHTGPGASASGPDQCRGPIGAGKLDGLITLCFLGDEALPGGCTLFRYKDEVLSAIG